MMVMIMMMMMMSPAGRQGKGGQGSLAWTRQADNLAELVTYGLWPPSSSTSSISSVGHLWLMASNHHQHQFPSAPPPFGVIHVNGHGPLNNVYYWTKQNIPMMITVKNMRKKAKFDPAPKRADDRPGIGAFCVLSTRKWETRNRGGNTNHRFSDPWNILRKKKCWGRLLTARANTRESYAWRMQQRVEWRGVGGI